MIFRARILKNKQNTGLKYKKTVKIIGLIIYYIIVKLLL